ncbi:MAG: hypothetical protein ACRDRN_12895 [Sciscionella sp.]
MLPATADHRGQTFYFSADRCHEKFAQVDTMAPGDTDGGAVDPYAA